MRPVAACNRLSTRLPLPREPGYRSASAGGRLRLGAQALPSMAWRNRFALLRHAV